MNCIVSSRTLRPLGIHPTRPRSSSTRSGAFAATLAAILIGWSATPAAAATFFVDGPNASCSNTGAGTEAQPFCTITAALGGGRAVGGNTFMVKPGIYHEQVSIPASGVSGSPIVLQGTASGVVVDGSDDYTNSAQWTLLSGNVWLASTVTWNPRQVFLDGARIDSSALAPASLPSRTFRWVSGSGLYVNAGGGNPATHQARIGRRNFGFTLPARSFITIDRFEVTRTEDRGINLSASCANVTLTRNIISFTNRMGIQAVGGSGLLIGSNTISDCNDHGIMLITGVTNSILEDNHSFRNINPTAITANGIHLFGCPGNVLRLNRVHDNEDTGLHIQSGSNNCIAYLNRSWNNGDHGYDHLSATGTIHVCDVAYGNFRDGFSIEGTATGTQVHNCIAVDNGLTTNEFDLLVDQSSTPGFVSNHNIFWNSTSQPPVRYILTSYATVSAYSAVSGQDAQTIQADPRFVNPAAGDFHLLSGSPAIDNGNSGAPNWPSLDADGLARFDDPATANTGIGPVSYSDRGAFEFRSTVANQAPDGVINSPTGNVSIAAGQSVSFTGTGSDPDANLPLTFLWNFGGGAASQTVEDPGNVVFSTPGTYTVTFTVTDALGLADPTPDTRVITVTAPTCSNLVANPSFETGVAGWKGVGATIAQVLGGSAGSFSCRVTGPASLSSFYIEDSPRSILSTTFGTGYHFAASVRSDQGHGMVRIKVIEYLNGTRVGQLDSPPVTLSPTWQRLEVDYSPARTGSIIYFTVKNTPAATSEAFDLDDASICRGVPSAAGPRAALIVTPSSGTAPLPVTADASGSTDVGSTIASYRFDFGDGTIVGPQPGATATHTYAAGTWTCAVTVTDNASLTSTATAPVTVIVPGTNQAPNGVINTPAGAVSILVGQSVSFTGTGSDPDNNLPLAFLWNFGGGAANRTIEDPGTVVFSTAGTYTVTFTVTDAFGFPDPTPDTRTITVTAPTSGPCTSNLVTNPSFETGVSGWKGVGATIAQVSGGSVGSFSCRVTGPASLSSFYIEDSPRSIASPTAGAAYHFGASVRSDLARGAARIRVIEYFNGTRVGQVDSPPVTLSPTWQRIEVDYSALQTGSTIYFTVKNSPAAASEAFDLDDTSICPGPVASAAASPAERTEGNGGALQFVAPTVAPNPLARPGTLQFSTRRSGALRVAVYDVTGRRVRTLLEDPNAAAGLHVLPLDDRSEGGARLSSGVYFYTIHSADGTNRGRFLIMR